MRNDQCPTVNPVRQSNETFAMYRQRIAKEEKDLATYLNGEYKTKSYTNRETRRARGK